MNRRCLALCIAAALSLSAVPAQALVKMLDLPGRLEEAFPISRFDFDGDGRMELVISPDGGITWEARKLDGSVVWSYALDPALCPQCTAQFEWYVFGVGDVDPASGAEVVMTWYGSNGASVYPFGTAVINENTGVVVMNEDSLSVDGILDINGDGTDELVGERWADLTPRVQVWGHGPVASTADPPVASEGLIKLRPAYPNPSRGSTRVEFDLVSREEVTLRVFDVAGRLVQETMLGALAPGHHVFDMNPRDARGSRLAPGVYHYRVHAGGATVGSKTTLIR